MNSRRRWRGLLLAQPLLRGLVLLEELLPVVEARHQGEGGELGGVGRHLRCRQQGQAEQGREQTHLQ